jgi:hypothetical protein
MAEPSLLVKFGSDLLSQGLDALAGAVVGARIAFYFERQKAAEDRKLIERRERQREIDREALAGNMALFTLTQMYNTLLNFWRQRIEQWRDDPLLWYMMPPGGEPSLEGVRFDYTALAFLLKGESPSIMLKLDGLADTYRTLADTVRRRSQMHETELAPRMESIRVVPGTPIENLEHVLGRRLVGTMQAYAADIRTFVYTSLDELPRVAQQLHELLQKRMPGENFIRFNRATDREGNPVP